MLCKMILLSGYNSEYKVVILGLSKIHLQSAAVSVTYHLPPLLSYADCPIKTMNFYFGCTWPRGCGMCQLVQLECSVLLGPHFRKSSELLQTIMKIFADNPIKAKRTLEEIILSLNDAQLSRTKHSNKSSLLLFVWI